MLQVCERVVQRRAEGYHGTILESACGSGGIFVHSAEFVRCHHRAPESEISVFGIEKMTDTLLMQGMKADKH
jgi:type I restriction enzyme M protein